MSIDTQPRTEVADAFREVAPVVLAVAPFGIVYGTVAAGAGLDLAQTMGMTAGVFAGASQLAAIDLLGAGAPVWSVLLTVVALNFRHVLYSAAIGRRLTRFSAVEKAAAFFVLVDPAFGAAEARSQRRPVTKRFYFTYALTLYATWLFGSFVGAIFGARVGDPSTFGLDLVLPVYFLALVITFRGRSRFYPTVLASAAASTVCFVLFGPPWHVASGAVVGILVAMLLTDPEAPAESSEARHG